MFRDYMKENMKIQRTIFDSQNLCQEIEKVAKICTAVYEREKKILICGNGGSASDALHMTGELVGRFQRERIGLPAIALNEDNVIITALSNDYSYDDMFGKQVVAYGKEGDLLIAISTSGNSLSVVNAAKQASSQNILVVSLTGQDGGELKKHSDYCLCVPSRVTAHIQESHIIIIHYICKVIENSIFA